MDEETKETLIEAVRTAIRSVPRVDRNLHLNLDIEEGALVIEGEVADVAAKKLALEAAAAVEGVEGIVDRLRVKPASEMDDRQIRQHVRDALLQEPWLADIGIVEVVDGQTEVARRPPGGRGIVSVDVRDQVVTLDGDVENLAQKRMAGVLAWWVPGSRDVVNGLGVVWPEAESDAATTDAVRAALEKDAFVNASQIRVFSVDGRVRLDGIVPTEEEREMAEYDAWYVFGVDSVDNRIEVGPTRARGSR